MTYRELEINTEIGLREKPHEECRQYKTIKYRVVGKYPRMCIVEDQKGKRRGVTVGELIANKIITQEPYFESLRKGAEKDNQLEGWRKRNSRRTAKTVEYAP